MPVLRDRICLDPITNKQLSNISILIICKLLLLLLDCLPGKQRNSRSHNTHCLVDESVRLPRLQHPLLQAARGERERAARRWRISGGGGGRQGRYADQLELAPLGGGEAAPQQGGDTAAQPTQQPGRSLRSKYVREFRIVGDPDPVSRTLDPGYGISFFSGSPAEACSTYISKESSELDQTPGVLDPGPGAFSNPESGSRLRDKFFSGSWISGSLSTDSNFFSEHVKKNIFQICWETYWLQKSDNKFLFLSPLLCCCCWIRDPGRKKFRIRNNNPDP